MARHIVMADVIPAGRGWPEAEPVVVETDARSVVLVLDDGTRVELDRRELDQALEDPAAENGTRAA